MSEPTKTSSDVGVCMEDRNHYETMLATKFPNVKPEVIKTIPLPNLSVQGGKYKSLEQFVEAISLQQIFQLLHLHPLRDRDKVLNSGYGLRSKLLDRVLPQKMESAPMTETEEEYKPDPEAVASFTPDNGSTELHLVAWLVTYPYYASKVREFLFDLDTRDFASIREGFIFKAAMQTICAPELQNPKPETYAAQFDTLLEKNLRNAGMLLASEELGKLKKIAAPLLGIQVQNMVAAIKRSRALYDLEQTAAALIDLARRPGALRISDICERVTKRLQDISGAENAGAQDGPKHSAGVVNLIIDRVQELNNIDESTYQPPLATGYPDLDRLITGLMPSCLYILAARPSVGKTAFALNVMENIALSAQIRNKPILFFSLEMSSASIADRMISTFTQTPCSEVAQGNFGSTIDSLISNTKKLGLTEEGGAKSKGSAIYICDVGNMTTRQMREEATLLANQFGGISLIVIDYLQLMHSANKSYSGNRNLEISEITRDFKFMSKDYSCPVLLLSQLNRSVESRSDATPQLSDLRDSGAIEQDADVIMFLSRQQPQKLDDNMRWLDVAKNRQGQTGRVALEYQGAQSQFLSRAQR